MPPHALAPITSSPTHAAAHPYAPRAEVSPIRIPRAEWPEWYTLDKRQVASPSLPACAFTCLEEGDQEGCSDHACLCRSPSYMPGIQACLSTTCTTATEWNAAYFYAQQYCSAFGVNIPSTTIDSLPQGTGTPTNPDDEPEGEPAPSQEPAPTVYTTRSKSTLTVDVVMGCVCTGLLVLAFILGGINIRKIYKIEQQQSQLGSRPYTHAGTQMSHIKSYNNFDFDPTRTTQTTRSAFAAGPSRGGGKSMNRGHDLTHLDARAFNAFPRAGEDDVVHVHTATTVETTPVSAEFPFGSEDGTTTTTTTTVHLADQGVQVPVLKRSSVQFVLEEEESDKDDREKSRG